MALGAMGEVGGGLSSAFKRCYPCGCGQREPTRFKLNTEGTKSAVDPSDEDLREDRRRSHPEVRAAIEEKRVRDWCKVTGIISCGCERTRNNKENIRGGPGSRRNESEEQGGRNVLAKLEGEKKLN